MAELVVFGVPYGEDVSACDEMTRSFIGTFYDNSKGIKTNVSRLRNNKVLYSYLVYADQGKNFITSSGRSGSYFGMSLIFENKYSKNPDKIFDLLKKTYDEYVKNKIIQEFPNGNKKWLYQEIRTPDDKIANYVGQGLAKILKTDPELNKAIEDSLVPLPPQQINAMER